MRRTKFAPMRRVRQEVNGERARSVFMVVNDHEVVLVRSFEDIHRFVGLYRAPLEHEVFGQNLGN